MRRYMPKPKKEPKSPAKTKLLLVEVADEKKRLRYRRKKREGGVSQCLVCRKSIPLKSHVELEQDTPRFSRAFCSQACGFRWAEAVIGDLLVPDPDLDIPDPERPGEVLAGPLLKAETKLARDAVTRLKRAAQAEDEDALDVRDLGWDVQ